jgi:hypothetical protein
MSVAVAKVRKKREGQRNRLLAGAAGLHQNALNPRIRTCRRVAGPLRLNANSGEGIAFPALLRTRNSKLCLAITNQDRELHLTSALPFVDQREHYLLLSFQGLDSCNFILTDETAISGEIGTEDGRQLTLEILRVHGITP